MTAALALYLGLGFFQAPAPLPTDGEESEVPVMLIELAEGAPRLRIPRAEELVYTARIDLGLVSANVGGVTQTARIGPYRRSVLVHDPGGDEDELETATIRLHARGDYSFYTMDSVIETRILPQDWPRISYKQTSRGTERRRKEVLIGLRDGAQTASLRRDTTKGAPEGTRIWRDPTYREVPEKAIDMLSAVFLTRTLIQEDIEELVFPLVDNDRLWQVRLHRGKNKRMETPAGKFAVVELLLEPRVYPGEEISEEKKKKFKGLFGIHGTIHLWVDRRTGIPVRIEGKVPLGPITLGVDVELESFKGTPEAFGPVE